MFAWFYSHLLLVKPKFESRLNKELAIFKLLISHFLIFVGWNFGTSHFCWLIFPISMSPPKAPCWCPWCLWRAPWRQRRAARWPLPPRRAHPLEIRRAEPKRWCCGVAGSRSCSTCQPLEKELLRIEGEDGGLERLEWSELFPTCQVRVSRF